MTTRLALLATLGLLAGLACTQVQDDYLEDDVETTPEAVVGVEEIPIPVRGFGEEVFKQGVVRLDVRATGLIGCLLAGHRDGTGFILDQGQGLVATAYHVVDDACDIWITPFGVANVDRIASYQLAASDPEADIAILEMQELPPHPALPLASSSASLTPGDTLCTAAYPKGFEHPPIMSCGRFLGRGDCGGVQGLFFDTDVLPGHSGGPLVNDQGELVGVVTRSNEAYFKGQQSCATPVEHLTILAMEASR